MKTYTFKIKLHYPSDNHPGAILAVVHCPLEVLFDSLKEVNQFKELYEITREPNSVNKEVPSMFITASDYVNSNGQYVDSDYNFCDYKAIIDCKTLTEFLIHPDYYGFVEDVLSVGNLDELKAQINMLKGVKKDEV